MKYKDKEQYARDVLERFEDARNHGRNGGSWWYPEPCVLAYDVKMRAFGDVENLRRYLSDAQNEYYGDELLADIIMRELSDTAELLQEDVTGKTGVFKNIPHVLDAWYAGRSGGWLEVKYDCDDLRMHVEDIDYARDNGTKKEVNEQIQSAYNEAVALDDEADRVSVFIEGAHRAYTKYVDTPDYYNDMKDTLLTDEDIKEEYEQNAQEAQRKADSINLNA